ncbi:MAG: fibrobacter succinogenes major paralogous domain-containing protein [Bacteroidetes bacterium]|nr:fibrobacter succinogenes major paralogous domain-containing protein [Bacteroidota bacterium]
MNQIWMAENLKTTLYNDGTLIPNVTNSDEWSKLTTGAYCYYDNNYSNNAIYGKLYNWYAVGTGKLVPKGWHVPTDAEWETLITYLGGEDIAGRKMKSTNYWKSPNVGASNSSGFNGLPAVAEVDTMGHSTILATW